MAMLHLPARRGLVLPAESLAILFLVAGVGCYALQDVAIKSWADATTVWQFLTIRSLVVLAGVVLSLALLGRGLKLIQPGWVILKSLFQVACMATYLAVIPFLDLTQLSSGFFTYPLALTVMAAVVLGEPIGPRRITALAFGFFGALLVVAPWTAEFDWLQLAPVVSGIFFAANITILRARCRGESPLALLFVVAALFLLLGLGGMAATLTWVAPADMVADARFVVAPPPAVSLAALGLAFGAAALNYAGNLLYTRAYQLGEATALAPFDYTYLAYASGFGILVFGEVLSLTDALGIALIVGAGSYIALREAALRRG